MTKKQIYLALHEAGLRNGSFHRSSGTKWAQYINGDFMGFLEERPKTYGGLPLVEFSAETAIRLIPRCCGGKGH